MIVSVPVFTTAAQVKAFYDFCDQEDAERAEYNAGYERLFEARRIAKAAVGQEWGDAYEARVLVERAKLDREAQGRMVIKR